MKSNAVSADKFLISAFALLAALCCEARIVHTPAAAVAANYQEGTNPAVDTNGGIWSFHQRFWWNDPNINDLTTPFTDQANSGESLVGYYGMHEGNDTCPYVAVNPTDHDLYLPQMTAGSLDRPVHPGEVVMHPYHFSDTVPHRGVLRFTTPRTGYYSFYALVRSMNNRWWETSLRTDITILVNNSIIFVEELIRPGDGVTYPDLEPFTFDRMLLPQGTTIDIVVGCGFSDSGNLGYQGDGVAIDLKITEEDETNTDLVDKFWNLNSAFWTEYQKEEPATPFADANGGIWAFYQTLANPFFFEYNTEAQLMSFWWNNEAATGPMVAVSNAAEPHLHVFDPDATTSVDVGLDGASAVNDHIAPGEISLHPGNPDKNLMIRFTVPEDGRYLASFALRDASGDPGNRPSNGVNAYIMAGSCLLSEDYVSCDGGHTPRERCAFRQVKTPELKAGQAIDLMIYNHASYEWDGTAGRYTIMKLKGGKDPNTFYPAEAFRANLAKAHPYTDADGCTWSVGKCIVPGSDFTLFTVTDEMTQLAGWHDNNSTAYSTLPQVDFNPTLDAIPGANSGSDIRPGQYLFPNEFFIHPNTGMCGTTRFQAPRDGVYSVKASARDIHPQWGLGGQSGVKCYVAGPGFYVDVKNASCDGGENAIPACRANLSAGHIFLRAGETIDLAVGVNGDRWTNCDATGVYEAIHVDEIETPAFVSVDLRNAVGVPAAPYALRGRAGWGDLLWNPTAFNATTHALAIGDIRATATQRTSTGFSLVRTPGEEVEPLDGTALNLGVNALLDDGVASTNKTDTFTFTFDKLPPNEDFTLYLYGTTVEGDGVPEFASNGKTARPTMMWSRPSGNEVAELKSYSDADGKLTGTFYNSTTNGVVAFCGVQLAGASLLDYIPRGTLLTVR